MNVSLSNNLNSFFNLAGFWKKAKRIPALVLVIFLFCNLNYGDASAQSFGPRITNLENGDFIASNQLLRFTSDSIPVKQWVIRVGSAPGNKDLHDSGRLSGSTTSHSLKNLPENSKIYLLLMHKDPKTGGWTTVDYTFRVRGSLATTTNSAKPRLTNLRDGDRISRSQELRFTNGETPVMQWVIRVGSSSGKEKDIHDSGRLPGNTQTYRLSNLPEASDVYVRLMYKNPNDGKWSTINHLFSTEPGGSSPQPTEPEPEPRLSPPKPAQPSSTPNNSRAFPVEVTAHQTDFLTAGFYTHLYASYDSNRRRQIRNKLLDSGYTHIYIYIMNQNDYGGPGFDFYERPQEFVTILKEINASGLKPVVWLSPDDAPDLVRKYHSENLIRTWQRVIPVLDEHVSSYVPGLEMDEYWTESQQNRFGQALDALTEKPIFVHMRREVWRQVLLPWADGIIYQYGFGKNGTQIFRETEQMLDRLSEYSDKIFIAGEYSHRQPESVSRQLGDAGIKAGAHGFGNGGTSLSGKVRSGSNNQTTDIEPPPLDLSAVRWLHTNVSNWSVTSNLRNVTFNERGQICLNHDKARVWPSEIVPSGGGADLYGNTWVFIWNERDSIWYGATWEWLRPGQVCKSSSSVEGGHIKRGPYTSASGWKPRSGETLYFMVSGLARGPERNVQMRSRPVKVVWP